MMARALLFWGLLFSYASHGSTCSPVSLKQKIEDSDYVFSGRVIDRKKDQSNKYSAEDHESCGPKTARFQVYTSWKGEAKSGVEVYSTDACDWLGTYFDVGEDYLVFAEIDKNTNKVVDLSGCYTELLIAGLKNKSISKLDRKFNQKSTFENSSILGVWESYGRASDKGYSGVDSVVFEFKNRNKFRAVTKQAGLSMKYKGVYYAIDGGLALYDQDGPQKYFYQIVGGIMVLESIDGQVIYHLKKT